MRYFYFNPPVSVKHFEGYRKIWTLKISIPLILHLIITIIAENKNYSIYHVSSLWGSPVIRWTTLSRQIF